MPCAQLGVTLPMVDGILRLGVPSDNVVIIRNDQTRETPVLLDEGFVVKSVLGDGHFFSTNKTRHRGVLSVLGRCRPDLPPEIVYDHLLSLLESSEVVSLADSKLLTELRQLRDTRDWVDGILAEGNYALARV